LLGLAYSLVDNPRKYGADPFFAVVEKKGTAELFVLMTPPLKPILYASHDAIKDSCDALVSYLNSNNVRVPGVIGPQSVAEKFVNACSRINRCEVTLSMKMRIYQLTSVVELKKQTGTFRPAEEKDVLILNEWIDGFHLDVFKGRKDVYKDDAAELIRNADLYVWDDSGIVSMVSRTRPTRHGFVIAYVYTPKQFRNKGYATAVVGSLCQHILSSGKSFCSLFADIANPTSNSIYQKIGFKPVRDFYDYSFEGK
jgi:predicted GNAT family acetyltransferase